VFITQGNIQSVEIEADKNIMDELITEVDGTTLELKTRKGYWGNLGKVNVYITMPEIDRLSISGSGDIVCEGSLKTPNINLNVTGSGSLILRNLETSGVSSVITGSGDIIIEGLCNGKSELNSVITGSGDFRAENFEVENADINITGSGSAKLYVLKNLKTNITGSGDVSYIGNPLVDARATGSGRTRPVD